VALSRGYIMSSLSLVMIQRLVLVQKNVVLYYNIAKPKLCTR